MSAIRVANSTLIRRDRSRGLEIQYNLTKTKKENVTWKLIRQEHNHTNVVQLPKTKHGGASDEVTFGKSFHILWEVNVSATPEQPLLWLCRMQECICFDLEKARERDHYHIAAL